MNRKMLGGLLAAASLGGLAHLARRRPDRADDTPDDVPVAIAEPKMDSAGAELMNIGWKMREHPDFADFADRVHEIGSWISMGRLSDMERMIAPVLGQIIAAMHKRGIAFDETLPMSPQITAFVESLPDPLPGQTGHVDQSKLTPIERRDAFEADVEIADVRRWTAQDGVRRAVAHRCTVRPVGGVEGNPLIYAQGEVDMLKEGATTRLWLRSTGGALLVVAAPVLADRAEGTHASAAWGKGPLGWDELVEMIHSLRLTIEDRAHVTDPTDQLRLDLELRSFTIRLFERLKRTA